MQSRFFDKSLVTNFIAILLTVVGYFLEAPYRQPVLSIGLFAFSGALTNWLAIHMLFEKVPGFYGSGVIPARASRILKRGFTNSSCGSFSRRRIRGAFLRER